MSSVAIDVAETTELDRLCVATIRGLCIDGVQQANSGHPGLPLGVAPAAYLLYSRFLRHDPGDPQWPDRDRFVLSAGHGSMLLYSLLHLAGYPVSLDDLRAFRQWGSLTPGHPEHGHTPGVETTTGPLGQGFGNGVGMAMAERFLRERYGSDVVDHRVFGICSDGDLMEGVSSEAASLAGHLGLGRIVYLYDDNRITIDGDTGLSFAGEDVPARFAAYGWHTSRVADGNDLAELTGALEEAIAETERPSLIAVRTVIGDPSPGRRGTPQAHGQPLGEDEARATKRVLGLDPEATFAVADEVRAAFAASRTRGEAAHGAWRDRLAEWTRVQPERAAEFEHALSGRVDAALGDWVPRFDPAHRSKLATRSACGEVLTALAPHLPTIVGGSADLAESTKLRLPEAAGAFTRGGAGATVHWGVREHAMGAALNGLALHGGIVRPFGATFLMFADYMRPAIRLSALMALPVVFVFTHDSVAVGEDGPTHQPVEHLASLRAIPGLTVIRPADANETAEAWWLALQGVGGPVCLVLTRQDVPILDPERVTGGVARGAYVLADAAGERADLILVATGSEVHLALDAREWLGPLGIDARVVSMPSWERFEAQRSDYRDSVLTPGVPALSVEAGIAQGWERWVDASVSIERFGASAPGSEVLAELGITAEHVVQCAQRLV